MTTSIVATSTSTRSRAVPWIGAGISGHWTNVDEALHDSGLDYHVSQSSAYDIFGNEVPGLYVNHNMKTTEIVGVTSNKYGVVHNVDAFSLLDPFCANGGIIEHAGQTCQGMQFMVMRMPGNAFGFEGDDFELYVCAMNSFNTKFPLALIITPVRVVCQNMFSKLMRSNDAVLTIKHGRFANDRIMSAKAASIALTDYTVEFVDELTCAVNLPRSRDDLDHFVERMLPLTPETPEHPRAKTTNERVLAARSEFVTEYYHAPDNAKYCGTKLGILNAYYDWVSHNNPIRMSANYEDIRFGNLISGAGVDKKLLSIA